MAKILTVDVLKALKKFDLPKGYQRTGEFPLDPSSVFGSKADADLYASGGVDSRGLSGTRYAGQIITVQENNSTVLYTVEANNTLKPVIGSVSTGLADVTSKVNAILNGASLDSFKDVEDKFASLPKDMVVSGGEVRVPTSAELTANKDLTANVKYIILTIANAAAGKDKLYIKASELVDVYKAGTYTTVSSSNVIDVNITALENKLVTDTFAKKSDITNITDTLATTEALNAVKATADANTQNIAAIKVKDVDTKASNGIALTLSAGKVGVSVSAQEVASASSTKKGVAEASDVKTYVDNKVSNYAPSTLTWVDFS